jgi:hypothetical protein
MAKSGADLNNPVFECSADAGGAEARGELRGLHPIHVVAQWKNTKGLEMLREAGVDLRAKDARSRDHPDSCDNYTPEEAVGGSKAAACEGEAIHHATKMGRVENILWLLDHGVPVDAKDGSGATPLQWAVGFGQVAAIESLLAAGASALVKDGKSRDVLFWAEHSDRLDGEMPQGQGLPRHPERSAVLALLRRAQQDEKTRGHPRERAASSAASTTAPKKQPTKKAAECEDPPCERASPPGKAWCACVARVARLAAALTTQAEAGQCLRVNGRKLTRAEFAAKIASKQPVVLTGLDWARPQWKDRAELTAVLVRPGDCTRKCHNIPKPESLCPVPCALCPVPCTLHPPPSPLPPH